MVLVWPLVEVSRDDTTRSYLRFLKNVVSGGEPWRSLAVQAFEPQMQVLLTALTGAYPTADVTALRFRLVAAATLTLDVMAQPDNYWPGGPPPFDETVEHLVGLLVDVLDVRPAPTNSRSSPESQFSFSLNALEQESEANGCDTL